MDDKVTVSAFQIFEKFPNQEAARQYLETRRWPSGAECPTCEGTDRITPRKGGYYRCNACKSDFTVRTGTVFERSHVPLHKWLYAMYLLVTSRKGISSLQLSKEISITQKSAWFVLQRLREACGGDFDKLRGIVEIDETFVGGKERNKHASKKRRAGRGAIGKQAVLGLRERGTGKSIAMPIEGTSQKALHREIKAHVEPGSEIHTDEHSGYEGLTDYIRCHVKHSAGEYVGANDIHVNSVESMWAVLKRGLYGTWHHASVKHLGRYVNECTFRLNEGNVKRHTLDRLDSFVDATVGRRITYRELIQ